MSKLSYKSASLIQAVLMILVGISLIDFGVTSYFGGDSKGLFLNYVFISSEGLLGFLINDSLVIWGQWHFYGYSAIVIGLLQIWKAMSLNIQHKDNYDTFLKSDLRDR